LLTAIFGLATALLPMTSSASAQMAAPQAVNIPIQAQWRDPFAQFLRDLDVDDPSTMIGNTYAFQIGGLRHPDAILFRIEGQDTCTDDSCFTVIGHIVGAKLYADAMFNAGNRFTRFDTPKSVFGFRDSPGILIGNTSTVTLFDTPNGWLIISKPNPG
jgi:hypothetical protein